MSKVRSILTELSGQIEVADGDVRGEKMPSCPAYPSSSTYIGELAVSALLLKSIRHEADKGRL